MSKSATMKARPSAGGSAGAAAAPRANTNTKWMIAGGVVVVAIAGLIVLARPGAVAEPPAATVAAPVATTGAGAGQLTALRTKFNFGTVSMAAGKVTHRFAISNSGGAPLVIRKLYTSCMCTTAALVKNEKSSDAFGMPGHTPIPTIDEPLAPTDQAYINVVFDPAAHGPAGVGPIERVVTVENDAGQPLELEFTALVTP